MYAVVNHLHFNKPVEEISASLVKEGLAVLSANPGFINFYFVKETENKAAVIILWQDAASAQTGAKTFGPAWFVSNIKPHLAAPEGRTAGEVIVKYKP